MTTPDFEEWLRRQDIPIEDTLEIDDYIAYLRDEIGISGGSLDIAQRIYPERYDILPQLGITPFEWHTTIQGVRYAETRYGITGLRGAFGAERTYDIALERASEREWTFAERWLRAKREL